jgi:rSAM/selenodomain-associated transferase 1
MTLLGMLARYWQPGAVKTRLAATVGSDSASRFHQACVRALAQRFAASADARQLVITPASQAGEFACFAPAWSIVPQAAGDLGKRMAAFFAAAAATGADRVVLIGSDSPTLPREYLNAAFERLREVSIVLGPATDGGYYLIGCRTPAPALIDGIAWSTAEVWRQTIERLSALGIPYAELPSWYDVDDLPSLRHLACQLQTEPIEAELEPLRQVVNSILAMPATQPP